MRCKQRSNRVLGYGNCGSMWTCWLEDLNTTAGSLGSKVCQIMFGIVRLWENNWRDFTLEIFWKVQQVHDHHFYHKAAVGVLRNGIFVGFRIRFLYNRHFSYVAI